MTLTPTEVFLYGSGIALFSAVLGHLVTHRLASSRDIIARTAILNREADLRRRQFLKVLHTFRGKMERTNPTDRNSVWSQYAELAPGFRGEAALVGSDFTEIENFKHLTSVLAGMRHGDVIKEAEAKHQDTRDIICTAIDVLIQACEAQANSTRR